MALPFKVEGKRGAQDDVTFALTATISDTRTIQRKTNEINTLTNGAISIQLRPRLNYTVNGAGPTAIFYAHYKRAPHIQLLPSRANYVWSAAAV